jgi:hypothetical protein
MTSRTPARADHAAQPAHPDAAVYIQRIGPGGAGSVIEAISTSNATTGNLFLYDATAGQYILNLGTKTLSTGTYQLRIDVGDGVLRTVNITLK